MDNFCKLFVADTKKNNVSFKKNWFSKEVSNKKNNT